MVSRRNLLSTIIVPSGAALAGCVGSLDTSSADPEGDAALHTIDVANGSEERHAITVTVENAGEETIFERTYDLGPRTGDENRIIDGDPAAFTVAVDDTDPVEFQWNPQGKDNAESKGCSKGTTTSLTIYYQVATDPTITPIYGCETVTDR